jgi:ketosteroid isomerase-like protein
MSSRRKLAMFCTLAMFFAAPALAGAADDMMAADKAFSDMSVAKGPHASFLAYMADDVRLYDGATPPIIGKAAVADYYAKNPDSPDDRLEWTPLEADASPDGVLGYTRGTWIYTGKNADGSAAKATGYYVTEWKRQSDGQYKFVLDIGGADKKPTKAQ